MDNSDNDGCAGGMRCKTPDAQQGRSLQADGNVAARPPVQPECSSYPWVDPNPLLNCRACPRLANFLDEVRAQHPDYHARPVLPFGVEHPRLLIVGLAPGMHGANRTGRPFTGDHAGILLYDTLHQYGFSTSPVSESGNDGLQLIHCRITNAVKCLPPANKPETAEIKQCNGYLKNELAALQPGTAILALGTVAHAAVLMALGLKAKTYTFAHGAIHALPILRLYDSYHCSRYNTQTRRLTPDMFRAVFARIQQDMEN